MSGAQAMMLPGGRLHLNHGPIDLVIEAFGAPEAVREGYALATARFDGLLEELVAELPALRSAAGSALTGPVARAMGRAVAPFRPAFITPMAAVAGAVADAVLAALVAGGGIGRAYVNNGGDIALHLEPGERLTAAIALTGAGPGRVVVTHGDPVRGIATSGWRGRSQSLGIADAVTVLARDAAAADAAATMIANAVDLPGDPAILRRPARAVRADSDLGRRAVTVAVAPLSPQARARALDRGLAAAGRARDRGLIAAAALFLQGEVRTIGDHARSLSHPQTEPCLG
ncbi:MAG: hypothetical protein CVT84_03220 [Alphaproteobacteria bacterium HGW-Alphaproteobacteria-6]|nr:MAG: hypothetical protein CVT84_03220 [Alphaproteobacteria bacterium HGW-Alphaproteobacteria-6]